MLPSRPLGVVAVGRTVASSRPLVEAELDRLRRLAGRLRDPGDRVILEGLLEGYTRVLEAYRYVPMRDPLEPLLLAMILELARRCGGGGGGG